MNAIELAYLGRIDLLQAIFGSSKKTSNPKKPPLDARGEPIVLNTAIFDKLFGAGGSGKVKAR